MKLVLNGIGIIFAYVLSIALVSCISGLVGSFCIPYTLNTWLIYAGKTASVTHMQGFLMGLIPPLGYASIFTSFGTWIAMLFLI